MGINPNRHESGYGYIEKGDKIPKGAYRVKRFVEKPNIDVAKSLLEKGNYLWNSGMFVWRTDRLLRETKKYIPDHVYAPIGKVVGFAVGETIDTTVKFATGKDTNYCIK